MERFMKTGMFRCFCLIFQLGIGNLTRNIEVFHYRYNGPFSNPSKLNPYPVADSETIRGIECPLYCML
jgi:hypothetical protein